MTKPVNSLGRLTYLDWVRLLAVFFALVYHSGRPFDTEDWHIKGATLGGLQYFQDTLSTFRLPLLFFVSGAGTVYALRKRTGRQYSLDRFKRLMVPLLVGMALVIPPQVYVERISHGMPGRSSPHDFYGSYWQFLSGPWLAQGPYPAGNISWHHLWFLIYLFFYSLVALPIFLYWRGERGQKALERFEHWMAAAPSRVWLLLLPMLATNWLLLGTFGQTDTFVNDWAMHAYYLQIFVLGFLLFSRPALLNAILAQAKTFLLVAVVAIGVRVFIVNGVIDWTKVTGYDYSPLYFLLTGLRTLGAFAAILAVIGYANVYLNRPSPFLERARHWVYPFYIFHQTVIVVLAYFVLKLALPSAVLYPLLMLSSLLMTVALSEGVQHTALTRFLFGVQRKTEVKKAAELDTRAGVEA